jgi:hypothetical protein
VAPFLGAKQLMYEADLTPPSGARDDEHVELYFLFYDIMVVDKRVQT